MAEAQLRLGDQSSADIKLFLTGPNDEQCGRNPVCLHSQILKRSKFLEDKFSKRWSSDKQTEIWVTTSHSFDNYLKCIEVMYGEDVYFSNIEECLAILSVASEILVDDCINECMQYLEAVRWSAEQESQIRNVVSCPGLKLLPDLAARLHQDDDDHMIFVKKSIQQMISLVQDRDRSLPKNRQIVEKYLVGMLKGNTSGDVSDLCGRMVLQEFKASIGSRNFSTLIPFYILIRHCKGGILKGALQAFCEDAEFKEYVKKMDSNQQCTFDIIMWFMKATGDGKIILPRASRVSLLTTWLPILGQLSYSDRREKLDELDKAVLNVVAEVYRLQNIDIATPYILSKDLQHVHSKSAEE